MNVSALDEFWGTADCVYDPNKLLQLVRKKPEWKKLYEDSLVSVRDKVYSQLPARVEKVCAEIRDAFIADKNREPTAADFDRDCANHKADIAARIAFLRKALGR